MRCSALGEGYSRPRSSGRPSKMPTSSSSGRRRRNEALEVLGHRAEGLQDLQAEEERPLFPADCADHDIRPAVGCAHGQEHPSSTLSYLLPAFSFLYVILAGVVPTAIASYTVVGEKVEKTLEPLLAAPVTDGEILLGKGISAFLPSILAILGGSVLFMVLSDMATFKSFGYYFFPNLNTAITLFLMVPLAILMSVEWNVVVSGRVTDVRVAQQLGGLVACRSPRSMSSARSTWFRSTSRATC